MEMIKFLKFGIVGFTGLIIDFCITWICKEKWKINKYVANSLGFFFGVTNNYFLNKYYTFENHNQNISAQFLSFLVISVIGLMFSTLIIYLFQKNTKLNFYYCKIIAIGLVVFWNFTANNLFTFNN